MVTLCPISTSAGDMVRVLVAKAAGLGGGGLTVNESVRPSTFTA